jgi:hypothetical protein
MKYLICSKNIKSGEMSNDSSNLNYYFELGWEMTTTHLYVKRLFYDKIINKSDCIVTTTERAFLYKGLFDNVIDYHDFLKVVHKTDIVIDLVSEVINFIISSEC